MTFADTAMALDTIRIPLSPLDHVPPRNYVSTVAYLPLQPHVSPAHAFEILQQGLHKTFVQLPWLSGKVYWQDNKAPGWRPGQMELRYTPVADTDDSTEAKPYQLKFKELDCPVTYEELKDSAFPTDIFEDEDILWAPFMPDVSDGAVAWVAQANFIPGCCILVSAPFHPVADGTGGVTLLSIWAQNCKAVQTKNEEKANTVDPDTSWLSMSADRTMLERIWAKEGTGRSPAEIEPAAWRLLGLDAPDTEDREVHIGLGDGKSAQPPPTRVMKSSIFYMPSSSFAALRNECARHYPSIPLSGNDVVCALVWRGLMKARAAAAGLKAARQSGRQKTAQDADNEAVSDPEARLEMTLDGRPDFSQSLPPTYLGNLVLINQASLPLSTLVNQTQTSIADVARVIRESASEISPARVMDAYTLVRGMPDYGGLRLRFTSVEGSSMMVTSLLMFPVDSVCFGADVFGNGGRAEAVRPLMGAFSKFFRIAFILPRRPNGGIEFVVSLYDEEMEFLLDDDEFGRFAMQL